MCNIFGIPIAPETLVGTVCSPEAHLIKHLFKDPESFLERIPVLIREKKVCVGEHIEMVNGKHYERDFIPIFSGDKYLGHLWQFNDITERKNAEQKLKESQERYRQIVESAMDIIYRTDIKGYYSYVNATVFSILGYVEEEVVGKHFTSFIRPDYISQTVEFYKRQVESQTLSSYFEFPVITKDLRQVWIGQNVQMVFENGKHKESSAIARNITDKILAEEKIQKSEEKYRSIIDHMKLGVLEVDIEEKITFAYDRFCQMTSYSAEELMGTHALDLMPVEYLKTFHTKNAERLNGHTGVYEVQIKKKNGQIMWALVSGAPLYDNHQQIIGSLGIHLDITEQKNIEQDLIKERKKAEESSKAKETFLANMSHEIRTPMNAIIGMANLIAGTDLTDKQKGYLEAINTSANNLLVIINDVLDFSKIESGKLALETIGFRLDNTVRSLMQSISYKADEKGISIAANIGTGISPVVIGDSVRLNQVLLNLMINAIKFTSQGHVELQCNLIAETPLIQSIEFKVTDTGIGISEHKLHTIYDSFSQEDESITRRFGGTGLGLSICKQIVELMGGQLHVISEKGKGSTFSFVIDFNKGTESDIEHIREEKKDVSLAGVKVLLVEDHKINRFLALSIMQEWKLVVDVAENGAIAVEKVKSTKYDIILMDMQMPVISGMEASRIIRNELKSAIPIIALTANASKADAAKCLKAGMNGYISKPFNPVHLYNTIAEHVQIEFPVSEEPLVRANMHEKLYDLSKLLTMYNGNKSLINKLIVIFKETTPQTLMQINEYYTHKKLHEVAMLAHQLKPAIDFLGISTLTTHIRFLEKCQLKNTADIQTSIDELNQVLAIVLQQLESEVE
jgi:PAS domain S-box-containing protein